MQLHELAGGIARRLTSANTEGIVFLQGVQSNQFPRAMDLARDFRTHGVAVVIGGFHVSDCLAMLLRMPDKLREALDLGIILFAGEAESHIDGLLRSADAGSLQPIYNLMDDLPSLNPATTTYLRRRRFGTIRRRSGALRVLATGPWKAQHSIVARLRKGRFAQLRICGWPNADWHTHQCCLGNGRAHATSRWSGR